MIEKIKSYFPLVILVEAMIIALLIWILWGTHKAETESNPLPSDDSTISRVTVTVYVPLKGLSKEEAKDAGLIAKDVAKNPDKAVLASGKVEDDSGSRNVSAVLDTKTGETKLEEKRPFMETMNRFEIGVGAGFESGDFAKGFRAAGTFQRIGPIFFTGQVETFSVDRMENRHPWNTMIFMNARF